MEIWMLVVFAVGILAIALEDFIKINKAAVALTTSLLLWIGLALYGGCVDINASIIESLGDISETLFFVMSSMVIVELVDVHGGFLLLSDKIKSRNKRRLLWMIMLTTFFMSALIDNLAAAIVMIALLRKIVPDNKDRWLYDGVIIIAANAGGSWSPIGDVTTLLLWTNGNITPLHQIVTLIAPGFTTLLITWIYIRRKFGANDEWQSVGNNKELNKEKIPLIRLRYRMILLIFGVLSLAMVPVFNILTGLPPFMGVLLGLSLLWIYTDLIYDNDKLHDEEHKFRISRVLSRIDFSTILFFLGILMSVAALRIGGVLAQMSTVLAANIQSTSLMALIIGLLSSVLDNVAIVAATMGMFPIDTVAGSISPYVVDGSFWTLLTYCAVTGGSILIIGSATGVSVMGVEKLTFGYYLKKFTPIALAGYLGGAFVYWLVNFL